MKNKYLICMLIALLGCSLFLSGCKNKENQKAKNIRTIKVSTEEFQRIQNEYKPTNVMSSLNEEIAKHPDNIAAYTERARLKENTKDYDGALSDYDAVLKINPDSKDAIAGKKRVTDKKRLASNNPKSK